ncbi:serine/arginine-rich splicing factor 2-like protein, partial [Trifolium pratense]
MFDPKRIVVDLWKVFGKYGRVGEVYVPNKVDKRGCRFGFVKFKEVRNVEELSKKLEDVWHGTYKLRVNLARFGRDGNKGSVKKKHSVGAFVNIEATVNDGKSFKSALAGEASGVVKKVVVCEVPETDNTVVERATTEVQPTLVMEPEPDFLHTLECSFVGKLVKGSNIKNIQLNLCMEGLRGIQA